MANALKCDRCGKFYTEKEKNFIVPGDILEYIKIYAKNNVLIDIFDLCDDCAEELWNWLNDWRAVISGLMVNVLRIGIFLIVILRNIYRSRALRYLHRLMR